MPSAQRLVLLLSLTTYILGLPLATAASSQVQDVRVTNFPRSQKVEGSVSVHEPIPAAELVSFSDITVAPVRPEETTRLVHVGTLEAAGFVDVVLSLVAQARGTSKLPGAVGVILLPDQEPFHEAFLEHGQELLSLRAEAPAEAGVPAFFASPSFRHPLAFPRYEIYLYNTTDITVRVSLYAYLRSQ